MYAINDHIAFPNTQLVHSLNINTLKKRRFLSLTFHSNRIAYSENEMENREYTISRTHQQQLVSNKHRCTTRNRNAIDDEQKIKSKTDEEKILFVYLYVLIGLRFKRSALMHIHAHTYTYTRTFVHLNRVYTHAYVQWNRLI